MKDEKPTPEEFRRLVEWLGSDELTAARKYEHIRTTLIRILARRGCPNVACEELVDITFNRVTRKVKEIAPGYQGEPAAYFHAVAHKVHLEWVRESVRLATVTSISERGPDNERQLLWACFDECILQLEPKENELIRGYYEYDGRAKIEHRRKLAQREAVTLHALRMRTSRIRMTVQTCAFECLKRKAA